MTLPALHSSPRLTAMAAWLRAHPWIPGQVRLIHALGSLSPGVGARLGPFTFVLDARDRFQAAMAVERYESRTAGLLARILRPGDTYLDVGAQLGYTAAQAARWIGPQGRMVLFEPDPQAYDRLVRHISSADPSVAPRIESVPMACSDRVGQQTFSLCSILGQSSLELALNPAMSTRQIQVPLTTLDRQVESKKIGRIRLMKMDVEGHELWALRGARDTLGRQGVDYLIVEKALYVLSVLDLEPHHLHGLLTGWGYVGAHEDGQSVTRDSLMRHEFENLLYARSADLLVDVFPRLDPTKLNQGYASGELEDYFQQAAAPDLEAIQARRIVRRAAQGNLEAAVCDAAQLLDLHPSLTHLRGHYAFWLNLLDRKEEALGQYRRIAAEQPDNAEVRQLIKELEIGDVR